MKVATLTFHGAHNYGSVLQAYALSKQLELMGNEVEIINLRPQSQKKMYSLSKPAPNMVYKFYNRLVNGKRKKRWNEFERFIQNVLPVTKKEYATTWELSEAEFDYDAYVCGSDQIWNPVCPDFETAYYLQFLSEESGAKKISYAPSFGRSEFDEKVEEQIAKWVNNFDAVSVREAKGKQLLVKNTEKEVSVVCDPVVLLDKKYWDELAVDPQINEPYMLVYFLENNHGNKGFVDELSKKLGLKVVVLTEYLRDIIRPYIKKYDASPEEFVGLFKHAEFIYTNSFHGTAFATIFNKPFVTVISPDQENTGNNNDSRKIDYLKMVGLEDRLVKDKLPSRKVLRGCNYDIANEKMRIMRESSFDYLEKALGGKNETASINNSTNLQG